VKFGEGQSGSQRRPQRETESCGAIASDAEGVVLAAEAEGIREACVDAAQRVEVACDVWNVIKVALGVGRSKVHCWRDKAGFDGLDACDEFDGASGLNQVAKHALDAAERDAGRERAKEAFDGGGFDAVVFFGAGAVGGDVVDCGAAFGADITWRDTRLFTGFFHGELGAPAFGLDIGDSESIGGGTKASDERDGGCAAAKGVLFFFENEDACAFAHNEAFAG